jgi:outer membrane protein assembly factor BamB
MKLWRAGAWLCIAGLAYLLAARGSMAAEPVWPQFRGPEANPVSNEARLEAKWGKADNIEWTADIPGRGWSSPIVSGDRIFVTTAITEGASKPPQIGTEYSNEYIAELEKQGLSEEEVLKKVNERDFEFPKDVVLHYFLYCLDLKSGKVAWKQEFNTGHPPGGRHRKNSFVSETPVTDGKAVFVYVANLGLYAFDMKGKALWTAPQGALPIYMDFGTGSSPVLAGDLLIIVNDNEKQPYIAAYNKRTGKEVWKKDRDVGVEGPTPARSGWSTPYVWRHANQTEIVTVGPGKAISYDLTGKEIWTMSGMSGSAIPMPFSYDGLLYLNGGRGRALYAIRPGATGDISLKTGETTNRFVVWCDPRGGTYLPTSVAYNGALYSLTETGILSRYDAKTGKLTYKTRISPDANAFTASPWAYNGRVFFLSEEGQTYVVPAGDKFELQNINALEDFSLATPAIAGDRLLLRTEHKLYSIRRTK